ncbi:MAG: hypothetical protein GC154_09280 [bacterium]|nr:hypothetical protein [bacterium]
MNDSDFHDEEIEQRIDDDFAEEETTVQSSRLGEGVDMEGRLTVKNVLEVAGKFRGDLLSNNSIKVLPGGMVEGNVDAFNVTIEGEAHADLIARKRLEILKQGKFVGSLELQPEVIVISEHARFGKDDEAAETFYKTYSSTSPKKSD